MQLEHEDYQGPQGLYPLRFLAHDFHVPQNVGSLFRIADAMGAEQVYLTGETPQPPHKKIRKTSRQTELHVRWRYRSDPLDVVAELREEGYQIVALEITADSLSLREMKWSPEAKVCLLLGSERFGMDEELLKAADLAVHIPMQGLKSSMNVTTAAAIAAYEILGFLQPELSRGE